MNYIKIACVFIGLCLLAYLLTGGQSGNRLNDANAILNRVPSVAVKPTTLPKKPVDRETEKKHRLTSELIRKGLNQSPLRALHATYSTNVADFWSARNHIHKNSLRETTFSKTLEAGNGLYLKLSNKVLTKPEYTAKYFPKDQAVARIFAVRYLEYLLKKNIGLEDIKITISELASKVGTKGAPKGIELDLEQLLTTYIRLNLRDFSDDYVNILQDLGLAKPNVLIFDTAIGLASLKEGNIRNLDEIFRYIHNSTKGDS